MKSCSTGGHLVHSAVLIIVPEQQMSLPQAYQTLATKLKTSQLAAQKTTNNM